MPQTGQKQPWQQLWGWSLWHFDSRNFVPSMLSLLAAFTFSWLKHPFGWSRVQKCLKRVHLRRPVKSRPFLGADGRRGLHRPRDGLPQETELEPEDRIISTTPSSRRSCVSCKCVQIRSRLNKRFLVFQVCNLLPSVGDVKFKPANWFHNTRGHKILGHCT